MTRILLGLGLGMMVWMSGHAATRCVRLDPTASCLAVVGPTNQSDGFVGCGEMTLRIIAMYSTDKASNYEDVRDSISLDSTDLSNNQYCWCRMVSPALSKWFYGRAGRGDTCWEECVAYFNARENMRSVVFTNLIN